MNRLATQPVSFQQSSTASEIPYPLPRAEIPQLGQELPGMRIRPTTRPAVFCPLHYERGYAYPLIVWLHGEGQSEQELRQIMPRISLRNYVAVAPRGTLGDSREEEETGLGWSQTDHHVELADEAVVNAVRFVESKLNVAAQRIFVAGRGAGGTMALRMALARPDLFAGAISLDGLLPRSGQPFRRVNELRGMPVLLSMRVAEDLCAAEDLCSDLRLLHAAGMSVSLRYYAGGDCLEPLMLADIDRWIMELICPSAG